MWRLAIWHIVWCLLQLDDLLVSEAGAVVNDLHRVGRLADRTRAFGGLGDLATVDIHAYSMLTNGALEKC
jgi:hypothetical protein